MAQYSSERTPFLVIRPAVLEKNVSDLRLAFPEFDLFYALKANPHPAVVSVLARLGVGFEVASDGELRQLIAAGVNAPSILCLHPIKSPDFLKDLSSEEVAVMAVDCADEVAKIARYAPGCGVLARLSISGTGSRIPLNGKFGCNGDEAVELLLLAASVGLRPLGLTLHVGSQCESPVAWVQALKLCEEVVAKLRGAGLNPSWISLGGGLPVNYSKGVPEWSTIGEALRQNGLSRLSASCRLSLEPGRALVSAAGTLVASVIGTANREGDRWAYLDAGIFHGLFEMWSPAGGLTLPVEALELERPSCMQRLAGPSCDSLDVLPNKYWLPALSVGDRVAFGLAGAYSTALGTSFNGFPSPNTVVSVDRLASPPASASVSYETNFAPRRYLQQYYSRPTLAADDAELFRILSHWLRGHKRMFRRALDFGSGPTLHNSFALCSTACAIELADFLPQNLQEIRRWLDEDSDAHDWDPLFRQVLTYDDVPLSSLEERKALYRARVVRLQRCDLRHVYPLEHQEAFDLVTSFFCAECVATSKSEWSAMIRRVANLVEPGGALFMAAVANASRYAIFDQWFECVPIHADDFSPLLESCDFEPESITTWTVPAPDWVEEGFEHICLVGAVKRRKEAVE